MNPTQHSFHSGRSWLSQLLKHHTSKILEELEKPNNVDDYMYYLDFAKAFDKLNHGM